MKVETAAWFARGIASPPCHRKRNKKSRRGRIPWGIRPRRLTHL